MRARFIPVLGRPTQDLLSSFNAAFQGYIGGEAQLDAETLQHFINREGVNLNLSRLALMGDEVIGLAMIARRGWKTRLATMGIVPAWQNQGIGYAFVTCLKQEAATRGDRTFELEVIEQNKAGLCVYERAGLKTLRRLCEFNAYQPAGKVDHGLERINPAEAANQLIRHGPPDLPWQLSGYTLVTLSPPNVSYRLGDAYAMMTDPSRERITLYSLLVTSEARGQGQGIKLLKALFAKHPDKHWYIPAICPESYAGFFEHAGFERGALSQFQMCINLADGAT